MADSSSSRWDDVSAFIADHLASPNVKDPDILDKCRQRAKSYYLPVYKWICTLLESHKAGAKVPVAPLIVGVSAPQGCGKTTLCQALVAAFEHEGIHSVSVSIDDFYLTGAELDQVAQQHAGNKLLQHRGNALTHDIALGAATLRALRGATSPDLTVQVPRYDKSARQGRGDRFPGPEWRVVTGPVDVVLFEGWMLGFRALEDDAFVTAVDQDLPPINAALRKYEGAWDCYVDDWIVMRVDDPTYSIAWRTEAEQKQREAGRAGMTDEQVLEFMGCYLPAYRLYTPGLYAHGPTTARPGHVLTLHVGRQRQLLDMTES